MKISLVSKTTTQKKNKALLVSFFTPTPDKRRVWGFTPEKAVRGKKDMPSHPFLSGLSREDAAYCREIMRHDLSTTKEVFREIHLPSDPSCILILSHLGKKEAWNERKFILSARKFVHFLKDRRIDAASIFFDDLAVAGLAPEILIRLLAENLLMANFTFNEYKAAPKEGWPLIREIEVSADASKKTSFVKALREGIIAGEEVNYCRMLSNTPGSDITPTSLAKAAARAGRRTGFRVTIWNEKKIASMNMGGILGVSKGSDEPPRFIIMEYKGKGATGPAIALVGKGVTFDTGGLNLKPGESMYEMHLDMSGGAAVIHGLAAIARMKLPVHAFGLVPAVENMPSGSSYRPGDILKTITGKTIEVLNTDAEGRVILADALGYADKFLKPKLIVDVATLTGAAMVALGQRAIALFTTSEKLEKFARDIGSRSGDFLWPLPLWDEYAEDVKGTFGDVANVGKTRYGGAIAGAMFLKQFVGARPWMHLDIAPTMTTIEGQFLAKGASGSAVRFLIELARRVKEIPEK